MGEYNPVRAMQDDASHWYLVPVEHVEEFRILMDAIYCSLDDHHDLVEAFTSKFEQYRTGGDLNNVQLYVKAV